MSQPERARTLGDALAARYLEALGLVRRAPGVEALSEIVRAHMLRVPFENVSKLYNLKVHGRRHLPTLREYLDGIERFHFGGTCYANNYHLNCLLRALGYDAALCGADMSDPDVHLVSIVRLDGREFIVDVGYAAPFLAPLPRDLLEDHVVELGGGRYVLSPQDAEGRSRLSFYRDGVPKHGYRVKPRARRIEDFAGVIADSYRETATFMNAILLARFFDDRSLVIHNLTVIENSGTESRMRPLRDRDELVHAVEEHFGIPPEPLIAALEGLGTLGDAWS
jgi:arylamine N-acetyltransferase